MNGLWKEELSGWNHKNSRRKKRTRKHYIRDNRSIILKNYDQEHICNQPLFVYDYYMQYRYDRSVKFAQKMIHKQIRTSVRDWINKAD